MRSRAWPIPPVVFVLLAAAALTIGAHGSQPQGAIGAVSEAQAADPLIGTWTLNLAKSTWDPGPPLKSQVRTFDYTNDGMIMMTNANTNAQGVSEFGHWTAKLDGTEGLEFKRSIGAKPSAHVFMTRTDPYTITIKATRNGKVFATGAFILSNDGKQLTQRIKSVDDKGKTSNTVAVYDKQ